MDSGRLGGEQREAGEVAAERVEPHRLRIVEVQQALGVQRLFRLDHPAGRAGFGEEIGDWGEEARGGDVGGAGVRPAIDW